jgi:hypothetical protein
MPCEVRSPPIQHQLFPSVQGQPPPAEQEAISPSGQEETATSSQEPPAGRHTTSTVTQDPSSREDRDALSSIPGQVSETVKANQCGHLQTDSKEKSIRTLPTLDIVWPAELHTCVICSVSFARARELTDHQNSTHPHPDFTCEFCKKQFAKREGLSLHKGKAHRKKVECTTRVMKGATARLKSPPKKNTEEPSANKSRPQHRQLLRGSAPSHTSSNCRFCPIPFPLYGVCSTKWLSWSLEFRVAIHHLYRGFAFQLSDIFLVDS